MVTAVTMVTVAAVTHDDSDYSHGDSGCSHGDTGSHGGSDCIDMVTVAVTVTVAAMVNVSVMARTLLQCIEVSLVMVTTRILTL